MTESLSDFPWLASTWSTLCQLRQRGQLPHALLLLANEGVGIEQLVDAWSMYCLCEYPEHGQACGQCKSCQMIRAATHPDVLYLTLQDAKQTISVEQVRQLNAAVVQTSQIASCKLVVISPVEKMTVNAANALLKTLEEPVDDTYFILVCHQPENLLATVRSRCQQISVKMPEWPLVHQWLQARCIDYDANAVDIALLLANGQPITAQTLLLSDLPEYHQALQSLIDVALSKQSLMSVKVDLKQISLLQWIDLLFQLLRLLVRNQYGCFLADNALLKPLLVNCQTIPVKPIYNMLDQLIEIRQALLNKVSLNGELTLQSLLICWVGLFSRE